LQYFYTYKRVSAKLTKKLLCQQVHYFGIADFLKRATSCGLLSNKVSTDQETETNKRPAETTSEGPESKRPNTNLETELAEVMDRLRSEKAVSLVLAGKENPSELCDMLLPLVGLSRPVVIYSQFREPLQDVYMKLKADKSVTALKLTEPWLRKYQIMPNRTHPEVLMSGSGGFVLSGVTVECDQ
jgi:tRNA (adenine58-N1)-methyltransferase non-catalytic subunit